MGFSLYFQILLADKRVVLPQQCLNFLHVCFREIGVFLRGNGSRNTGGFTHCGAHGHHTHRALNALITRNGTPGDDHVFHALRQQSAVGNAVRFARAVAGITLFTVNLTDGCKLRFLERIVHTAAAAAVQPEGPPPTTITS